MGSSVISGLLIGPQFFRIEGGSTSTWFSGKGGVKGGECSEAWRLRTAYDAEGSRGPEPD